MTGSDISDVDGLLGVDGPANLFLLNPNGIIFGPNAELDISGSFLASTGDRFTFEDGTEFSSVPQANELLSISVPIGVQFNNQSAGDISSTGSLETGADLTLSGNQLFLQGQLEAGEDLSLLAQDTLTIRDTATDAFLASSAGDLILRGNQGIDILALQHLEQTPFISGGNLSLISDGMISGDAHFSSGGNIQFQTLSGEPGDFVSLYDPIISSDGNVVFGNYTGAALKVEARGSIKAGNIVITGPDTAFTPDGSGSDADLLASSRAAILRAGVTFVSAPNVPQVSGGTIFTKSTVFGQPPGSIVVDSINTSNTNGGDGGPIVLEARGNIETTGSFRGPTGRFITLGTFSYSDVNDSGNGGPISISSTSGNINIRGRVASSSFSPNGDSRVAGEIKISSISGDIETFNLDSFSRSNGGDSGDGGAISITNSSFRSNINITTRGDLNSSSISQNGTSGNGGPILINSRLGDIRTRRRLESSSSSSNGIAGNGGDISIISTRGNIRGYDNIYSTSKAEVGNSGNGGDISITTSSSGAITGGTLRSGSYSSNGNSGNGGNIIIRSTGGNILREEVINSGSQSLNGSAGDGGDISISSDSGTLTIRDILTSNSKTFN